MKNKYRLSLMVSLLFISLFVLLSLVPVFATREPSNIELNIHSLSEVRNPVPYTGTVEIIYKAPSSSSITLTKLSINQPEKRLQEISLSKNLRGIEKEWTAYQELIATPPVERTVVDVEKLANTLSQGMHHEKIQIDPNIIFVDGFEVGNEKTLTFILEYEQEEQKYSTSKELTFKVLPPLPTPTLPPEETTKESTAPTQKELSLSGDSKEDFAHLDLYSFEEDPNP